MRAVLTALALLAIASATMLGGAHLAVGSTAGRVHRELGELPPKSVVIVPGAGLRADGTPHGFLAERLECALRLFESGRVQHILVSGDNGTREHDETTAMQRWLLGRGIPADAIHEDYAGFRTRDTMERAARIFGVHDAVICTQGLHANRAVYLALDAGIDAVALVARGDSWLSAGAWLRERVATLMAVFDVLAGTEPRYLGPALPIAARR
jgi:SanA protein